MKDLKIIAVIFIVVSVFTILNILSDMYWFYNDMVPLFHKFDVDTGNLIPFETAKFSIVLIVLLSVIFSSILLIMKKNKGRILLLISLIVLIIYMFIAPLFYIPMPVPRDPMVPIDKLSEMFGYFNLKLRLVVAIILCGFVYYLSAHKVRVKFIKST